LAFARLQGINLNDATLRDADLSFSSLEGASVVRGDLANAQLLVAYMSHANLTGANLDGAAMTEASLIAANLSGATLRGARLIKGHLYKANLSGADLEGADLTLADLRDTNLTNAKLGNACLRLAVLRGADLTGADLTGVDLTDADTAGVKGASIPPDLSSVCTSCEELEDVTASLAIDTDPADDALTFCALVGERVDVGKIRPPWMFAAADDAKSGLVIGRLLTGRFLDSEDLLESGVLALGGCGLQVLLVVNLTLDDRFAITDIEVHAMGGSADMVGPPIDCEVTGSDEVLVARHISRFLSSTP
jgi:hypothetical protein